MNNIEAMARAIFASRHGPHADADAPVQRRQTQSIGDGYALLNGKMFHQAWTVYWPDALAAASAAGIAAEPMLREPDRWVLVPFSTYTALKAADESLRREQA